jgi:hypothetical protein
MAAIVIRNLAFDVGPRKLVVFRVDRRQLPHLTVSWDNSSGEVDVHFTPQVLQQMRDRESVARFPQSEVRPFLESIGKAFDDAVKNSPLGIIWAVRPAWLARNHYRLVGPEGESIVQWLHRAAPKIRGKYRLDLNVLKKIPKQAFYRPTAKRMTDFVQQGLVYAVCTGGCEKGRVIILTTFRWADGSSTWLGFDYHDLQKFARVIHNRLITRLRSVAPDEVARVYEVLRLKEIGW